jgi:capsule biosynthesis phosphatase
MVREEKCIVVDVDGTLCPVKGTHEEYEDLRPFDEMIAKLREYRANGYYIILQTSRNMRTYGGNIGLIMANTAKILFAWLDRYKVPYDEIHFGKPWASRIGFYVDDRAIRPDEFLSLTPAQIHDLLAPKVRVAAGE